MRKSCLCAILVAAGVGSGCYSPGGRGFSEDQFTYQSHAHQPWTVSIVDTRTSQTIWSIDVPVGQQLVIKFLKDEYPEDEFTPDLMTWALMDNGTEFANLPNKIAVPPKTVRRIDTRLRQTPELPRSMTPGRSQAPVRELEERSFER